MIATLPAETELKAEQDKKKWNFNCLILDISAIKVILKMIGNRII